MGRSALGNCRFRNRVLCLDDLFSLDIRQWRKDKVFDYRVFEYTWRRHQQSIGRIHFQLCDDEVSFDYKLQLTGIDEHEGRLSLTTTPCNYGGKRYWFVCHFCQRKAAKLYLNSRSFQCRHCCALPYKCQNETPSDRNIRRVRSVRRLLDASDNILDPVIAKPLGMHWDRFEQLLDKAEQMDAISEMWLERTNVQY
jgi:hypothetical protein